MPPIFYYICAFACHPRLFASKDEAAIVSQSIGDGRRDRACLGYGMAVGKVTGHSVISIKLGGRQEQRANAAFIPLSLPSTFSLFLLGRAALAGPPAIPILSACLVRASRSPSSFRTEQRSSSPRFVKLPRPVQVPVSALLQQALHLQTDTNLHGAMGNLVWHEYARYVSLTATVCEFSSW